MTKNSNCYSWLPFFEELLNRICSEYNSESLYTIWNQFFPEKYEDIGQIDPFSFIGKFNSLGDSNYKKYCEKLKEIFKLKSDVPTDFNGIPRTNRTNPVFFNEYWKHFKNNKETIPMDKIMENLWKLANSLNNGEINKEFFSTVLSYQSVGLSKLTQLFFLCKPHKYYSYDSVNRAYLKKLNGGVTENSIEGFYKFQELAEKCKKESYIFSHEA